MLFSQSSPFNSTYTPTHNSTQTIMAFHIEHEFLNGIVVLKPDVFGDHRGFFMESYRSDFFAELGLPTDFKQDNHSRSSKGVLRGLHFQWAEPMGKLIRVTRGSVQLVEVDIRRDSPTLGDYISIEVSEDNKRIVWVPAGFANGFLTLSDTAEMQYKCTATWNPKAEGSISWKDSQIGIEWLNETPLLSEKDANAQSLQEWIAKPESDLLTVNRLSK
jgi:dTDP-4-dehydrorhamnose 3,5-epimerase